MTNKKIHKALIKLSPKVENIMSEANNSGLNKSPSNKNPGVLVKNSINRTNVETKDEIITANNNPYLEPIKSKNIAIN